MANPTPVDPRRFQAAAAHYREGRPAYAPLLIRRVARLCGLHPGTRMLDLGCGPGLLAAAFAPWVAEVVAMDPEPEMLAQAAAMALPNLRAVPGGSADLSPALGSFRLTVMGRSFHWMDRTETLCRLDGLTEPGGAVALFSTHHPDLPATAWVEPYSALRRRYRRPEDRSLRHRAPGWVRHEGVLLDSAFCALETISVIEARRTGVATLVERMLSMSSTAPELLATGTARLSDEIAALLAPFSENGTVAEVVESHALIGFRPGEVPA